MGKLLNTQQINYKMKRKKYISPIEAMQIPPSASDRGPPHVKNFSSGAHAAVRDKADTAPAV